MTRKKMRPKEWRRERVNARRMKPNTHTARGKKRCRIAKWRKIKLVVQRNVRTQLHYVDHKSICKRIKWLKSIGSVMKNERKKCIASSAEKSKKKTRNTMQRKSLTFGKHRSKKKEIFPVHARAKSSLNLKRYGEGTSKCDVMIGKTFS